MDIKKKKRKKNQILESNTIINIPFDKTNIGVTISRLIRPSPQRQKVQKDLNFGITKSFITPDLVPLAK